MKKRDRREFERYVRWIANELELRDWTVQVDIGDPEGPEHAQGHRWGASSESIPGRKNVTVTFDPACRDWRRKDLRATVAHELIHAHLAACHEMIRTDLYEHLARPTYSLFYDGFTRHLEFGVDAMADAVAKHLPLIEWPADG